MYADHRDLLSFLTRLSSDLRRARREGDLARGDRGVGDDAFLKREALDDARHALLGDDPAAGGVVDAAGRLDGIITDGDLRRHMAGLLDRRSGEVMTRRPRTIGPDALAAIPFDFDFSGFVNAPNAIPDVERGIERVGQRLYRGYCVNNAYLEDSVARFDKTRD